MAIVTSGYRDQISSAIHCLTIRGLGGYQTGFETEADKCRE
jgi:hypothetical protein